MLPAAQENDTNLVMRRSGVLALLLFIGSFACGSSGSNGNAPGASDAGDESSPSGSTPTGPDTSNEGGAPSGEGGTIPGQHVTGVLKASDGTPGVGLEVRLIDATGTGRFVLSDDQGGFKFDGITLPYDLHVQSGADYFGLHATTLALPAAGSNSKVPTTLQQLQAPGPLTVTLPDCGATSCQARAFIDLADAQALTGTTYAVAYQPGAPPASINTSGMLWYGAATVKATVRVLVAAATAPSRYWYAEQPATLVADVQNPSTPGKLTLAAALALAEQTTNPLALTIDRTGLAATDQITAQALLAFPQEPAASSIAFWSMTNVPATTSIPVPNIANATLVLTAQTQTGAAARSDATFRGPLNTPSTNLALIPPPTITGPVSGTPLLPSTVIAWTGAPGLLYRVDMISSVSPLREVYTTDASVAYARWEALAGAIPATSGNQGYAVIVHAWRGAQSLDAFVTGGGDTSQLSAHANSEQLGLTRPPTDAGAGEGGGGGGG